MRLKQLLIPLFPIALFIAAILPARLVQAYSGLPYSPYAALIDENPQAGYGLPYNTSLLQSYNNYPNYPGTSYLNQPYSGFGFLPGGGYGWDYGWNQPSYGYSNPYSYGNPYGYSNPYSYSRNTPYTYGWNQPSYSNQFLYGWNQPDWSQIPIGWFQPWAGYPYPCIVGGPFNNVPDWLLQLQYSITGPPNNIPGYGG